MTSQFLSSLRAEISNLEAELERDPRYLKLRGLQDVLRLYEGGGATIEQSEGANQTRQASGGSPLKERDGQVRQPSEARVRAVALSADFIRGRTSPTPTREIHSMLVGRGVEIGGKEPVSNLSAILSKSEGFRSIGRSGWILEPEGDGNFSVDATPDDEVHEDHEAPGVEVDDQGAGGALA